MMTVFIEQESGIRIKKKRLLWGSVGPRGFTLGDVLVPQRYIYFFNKQFF
jgi:hypothetical protein